MKKEVKDKTLRKELKEARKKRFNWQRYIDLAVGGLSIVGLMALSAYGLRKLFEAMPDELNVILTVGVSSLLLYAVVKFIIAVSR